MKPLRDILFEEGYGTRRACELLIRSGSVSVQGTTCVDPCFLLEHDHLALAVLGRGWVCHTRVYLAMNKPAGYEVSRVPSRWPSVFSLIPPPLRQRPSVKGARGVQAVGRLDQDTTGLLLLSDDGLFIHKMSSPKHHVPKMYQVGTADPVDDKQVRRLLDGVVLDDDPRPVRAAACQATGTHSLDLTLTEGKYHQVKRMLAAVGNRVVRLHRSRIGSLALPAGLTPGEWQWLTPDELAAASDRGK